MSLKISELALSKAQNTAFSFLSIIFENKLFSDKYLLQATTLIFSQIVGSFSFKTLTLALPISTSE